MFRHQVIAMLAALVALAACGQQQQAAKSPPPAIGFITIKEQPVELATELPGRTNAFAVSEVRPQVSGIIKRRLFVEGSTVKAGQPLYQIDPAPYQAAFDSAEATRVSAKAKAERYRALFAQNAIAAQDNDDAQAAWRLAEANARAARINLGYTRITAPITGRISASTVTEGALVTAAQTTALTTITTLDPIYVDIDQSSSELLALERQVQKGVVDKNSPLTARVGLVLDDGSTYPHEGKLQMTDVLVDPATGSVRLRAIFPNPEGLLLPGLYVRATLIQGIDPHGILAPQRGITHDQKGQPTALVLDDKNFARLRFLKTGRAIGGDWQVLDGLKPGDRLIVDGLQKVQPDMPVSPQPAQSAQPAQKP